MIAASRLAERMGMLCIRRRCADRAAGPARRSAPRNAAGQTGAAHRNHGLGQKRLVAASCDLSCREASEALRPSAVPRLSVVRNVLADLRNEELRKEELRKEEIRSR